MIMTTEQVINSFTNLYNNLTDKGIIVLMCGKNQSKEISDCFSRDLNSNLIFSRELNRKVLMLLYKSGQKILN